jgi:uncharacterized protein (TIGR03000 family)
MFRPSWKYLILGAVLLGTVAIGASQAEACWWCGWRGCYSTCYAPCYTVSYDPCCYAGGCYLGWRPGPVRRLLFGPYRWYCGSWGWWGGSGWQVACYDTVEVCEPEAEAPTLPPKVPTLAAPEQPPAPEAQETPKPPAAPETPSEPALPGPGADDSTTGFVPARGDSGLLTIRVPADAQVVINGLETKSTGSRREYVSYGLKPGLVYRYEIRARIVRNGRLLEDARTVYLTAGARKAVALYSAAKPEESIATLW